MLLRFNSQGDMCHGRLTHRRDLTRQQWRERVRELRRQANMPPNHFKCGITVDDSPVLYPGRWPIQIAYGLALDYTFDAAYRTATMLQQHWTGVEVVPYLTAQGMAEDFWDWFCLQHVVYAVKRGQKDVSSGSEIAVVPTYAGRQHGSLLPDCRDSSSFAMQQEQHQSEADQRVGESSGCSSTSAC